MTAKASNQITRRALGLALSLLVAGLAIAQTPAPTTVDKRGVIRLKVKVGTTKTEGFARKRFFLIKGSLKDNDALIQEINNQKVISRDCFYQSIGASNELRSWIKEYDCESVFCPQEVDEKYLAEPKSPTDPKPVREFAQAVKDGEKIFGRELARKWLIVNLSEEIRDGFYRSHQDQLKKLIRTAEGISKAPVKSVMTDRNGTAFFTDLEAGTYVISNFIPAAYGETTELWNCEVQIPLKPKPKAGSPEVPGDLGLELPWLIANPGNTKDKNIKCLAVEKVPPACPPTTR